jgi:hypothetical protein
MPIDRENFEISTIGVGWREIGMKCSVFSDLAPYSCASGEEASPKDMC